MTDSTVTTLDDEKPAVEAAPKTVAKPKGKNAAAAEAGIDGDETKTITIHAGEGTAGREDVFVAVNGYAFNIKRGKPVQVPASVVGVLTNAVTTQYENGEAIDIPRYAMTVHN